MHTPIHPRTCEISISCGGLLTLRPPPSLQPAEPPPALVHPLYKPSTGALAPGRPERRYSSPRQGLATTLEDRIRVVAHEVIGLRTSLQREAHGHHRVDALWVLKVSRLDDLPLHGGRGGRSGDVCWRCRRIVAVETVRAVLRPVLPAHDRLLRPL